MAGTKRSRDGTFTSPRAAKAAKKDSTFTSKNAGEGSKKGSKANIAASSFLANALPITVNVANTPPSIPREDEGTISAASADPGYIGGVKCLATRFSIGSYGWKGRKRVTIEVTNKAGEIEKVQVQISINATVLEIKNALGDVADDETVEGEKEVDNAKEKAEEAELRSCEPP